LHHVLADFAETEAAMEQQGVVVARLEEDFAGQLRVAQFGVALHIGIQRTADATSTTTAGDRDAIDVEELRLARLEPAEIVAVVRGTGTEADQEAGDGAIAFGNAEIFGRSKKPRSLAASSGRMAGPAALFSARTESSSCSRTSRTTIDIRDSVLLLDRKAWPARGRDGLSHARPGMRGDMRGMAGP
jgi:hypothetical protein